MSFRTLLALTLSLSCTIGLASDWARFRGPNGSGISLDENAFPVTWSPTEKIKWKAELPGPGASSPIVVGDRIYVTCYSGFAVSPTDMGDMKNLKRHMVCLDRATGKVIWTQAVDAAQPEDEYEGIGVTQHGYASHTPVSDGKNVYAFFGKSGMYAFDKDGKQLWHADTGKGSDPRGWGSASSPILFKNLVIATATSEARALIALDKESGKVAWRQEADGFENTWGTPVLAEVSADRTDLVLGVPYEIWGFNPENGKIRWFSEAMQTDTYCSSVVNQGDMIYGIEGRGGGSIALRAGGQDDVQKTNVVWTGRDTSRIGTPVVYQDRIYFFSGRVVNCIDAKSGKSIYQQRLTGGAAAAPAAAPPPRPEGPGGPGGPGGPRGGRGMGGGMGGQDYASPIIAGGNLYYVTRNGDLFVIKTGAEFQQLAVNRVTADAEDFSGTPAASDGQLFIRSNRFIYCVADTATAK